MDKTEKVIKDPKRVEAARKGREKDMNKLKESILNDAKKVVEIPSMQAMKLSMQAMKLPALLTMQAMKLPAPVTAPPQDQMILMFMVLVYLLFLPSVLVYFLHIRLKIKNKTMIAQRLSMSKKRINHQKDVICFSKICTVNG